MGPAGDPRTTKCGRVKDVVGYHIDGSAALSMVCESMRPYR